MSTLKTNTIQAATGTTADTKILLDVEVGVIDTEVEVAKKLEAVNEVSVAAVPETTCNT